MTSSLPHDLAGLALMVFLLGLRHGMDPDHLATIDGLARYNGQNRPRLARWSGCFFSLGHGAIVTLVAGFVAATLHDGAAPQWLERVGAWVARMVERADRRARVASRVMGLAIAFLGIGIASLGMARLLSAQAAAVLAGAELPMGFGVAIIVVASFAVAMRLARPRPA